MRSFRALGLLLSPLLLCGSSLASIHPDIGPSAEGGGGGSPPAAPENPQPTAEAPPTVKLPSADPAPAGAPETPSTAAPAREPDEDLLPEPVRLHLSIYSTDGEGKRIDFLPEVCFSANEAAVRGFNRFVEELGRVVILGGKKIWDQRTPAPFAPVPFPAGVYPPPPTPEQVRKAAEEAAERMHNHEVAQRLSTEAARLRSEGIVENNEDKQRQADRLVQHVAELLAKGPRFDGVACIPGCR